MMPIHLQQLDYDASVVNMTVAMFYSSKVFCGQYYNRAKSLATIVTPVG